MCNSITLQTAKLHGVKCSKHSTATKPAFTFTECQYICRQNIIQIINCHIYKYHSDNMYAEVLCCIKICVHHGSTDCNSVFTKLFKYYSTIKKVGIHVHVDLCSDKLRWKTMPQTNFNQFYLCFLSCSTYIKEILIEHH